MMLALFFLSALLIIRLYLSLLVLHVQSSCRYHFALVKNINCVFFVSSFFVKFYKATTYDEFVCAIIASVCFFHILSQM